MQGYETAEPPGGSGTGMYQFSRSIYRELAPKIATASASGCASKQQRPRRLRGDDAAAADRPALLRASRPSRCSRSCATYFPISEQLFVYRVVDRNVRLALRYLESVPPEELALVGAASAGRTRAAAPRASASRCPSRDYCPSHKHLEEDVELDRRQPSPRRRAPDRRLSRQPGVMAGCCSAST